MESDDQFLSQNLFFFMISIFLQFGFLVITSMTIDMAESFSQYCKHLCAMGHLPLISSLSVFHGWKEQLVIIFFMALSFFPFFKHPDVIPFIFPDRLCFLNLLSFFSKSPIMLNSLWCTYVYACAYLWFFLFFILCIS